MNDDVTRKKITFYGWVQVVGLRYRAYYAARDYGVSGWVKNNYDGSVSMEIQGTENQIGSVIFAIEKGTYVRIESMESRTIPIVPDERDFRIR